MMNPPQLIAAACFPLLLLAGGSTCLDPEQAAGPWTRWSTLQFKAKAAPLFRGRVEMRRTEDPEHRHLETVATASFMGVTVVRSTTKTTFEPATGRTIEYSKHSKKYTRRYVFGDHGYTVEKLLPAKDPDSGALRSVASRVEFENPPPREDGTTEPLFDYYGMLLKLRDAGLDRPGDEVTVFVATSKGPEQYTLRVAESRENERSFIDLSTGQVTTLPVREFRLTVSPTDPESAAGFLKMKGETEIWVEADSKTILEIGGKIPRVPGRVRLVLSAMG